MFSGIVIIKPSVVPGVFSAERVLRTLAALVPATVAGVVADVILVASTEEEGFDGVAERAGCEFAQEPRLEDALAVALARARRNHLLILYGGYAPAPGFHQELDSLLHAGFNHAVMRCEADNFWTRVFPQLARVAGLATTRQNQVVGGDDIGKMARKLDSPRLLRSRALVTGLS